MIMTLPTEALDDDSDELTEDEITEIRAGIRRGYDAAVVGRERSLSAYATSLNAENRPI